MKISHIEHLGIAVKSIEEALPYYENVLGLKCYNIETVEDQKVRTAFLKVGETKIELLEPTCPESTIAKFIENKGAGVHHVAFAVEDGVANALAAGLKPIVCVGELLWERECNITEEVIARQVKLDFFGVSAEDVKKSVIAYEPVWAIGTGKTATADQAEEVCAFIRATLAKIYDEATAEAVTIQYGGSMNAKNCAELLSKENVDGGLIGGASLKAADFNTIVQAAVEG